MLRNQENTQSDRAWGCGSGEAGKEQSASVAGCVLFELILLCASLSVCSGSRAAHELLR